MQVNIKSFMILLCLRVLVFEIGVFGMVWVFKVWDQNFRSLSFRGHPFVSTEKLSALEKLKPDAEEIHFCSTTTSLKELFYVTGTISVSQFFVNVQ